MSQSGRSISFKILQLIVCIMALIFKKITDNKARMILRINQKTSNEWNLLQNVTWSQEGNDFSIFTYAGYTFIIAVCLLDRIINFKRLTSTTDALFLRFGVIIFILQGQYISKLTLNQSTQMHIDNLRNNCGGVFLFVFVKGIMVFYSVEYVPENIRINALILGGLSFIVAVLFFLEDCLTAKQYEMANKLIQTETLKPISSIPLKVSEDNILHTYV